MKNGNQTMTLPSIPIDLYQGQGQTLVERGPSLPEAAPFDAKEKPENYIASDGLRDAVNVALALGQPLLVTGEPGTGKTRLARSVAWELGLAYQEFHVKTSSMASDLLYHYDALARFQDIHLQVQHGIERYLTLNALGKAILLTLPLDRPRRSLLPEDLRNTSPCRSVVLLDEIDKAPRDLPNDALDEVERMRFRVKEAPDWPEIQAAQELRPVTILTSNSEKSLPDAFLRRCVFHHIPFPDPETLKTIVRRRFAGPQAPSEEFLAAAVDRFMKIRGMSLRKKPATGEFLAWISFLTAWNVNLVSPGERDERWLDASHGILAKNEDDEKLARKIR